MVFKLGVWEGGHSRIVPATWDGIFTLIDAEYPKLSSRVRGFETDIRERDCDSIEEECPLEGFKYAVINMVNHPLKASLFFRFLVLLIDRFPKFFGLLTFKIFCVLNLRRKIIIASITWVIGSFRDY